MTHEAFKLEYIHPTDSRFMSFTCSMANKESTGAFLAKVKWAMNQGVELRVRPIVEVMNDHDMESAIHI